MNKFNNVTSLIVVAVLAFTTGVLVLGFRSCRQGPEVKASLSATEVEVNERFTYSDSTHKARNWYWEFGDKESSYKPHGTYWYKEPGTFKVRLTVNGKYEKTFTIQVKNTAREPASRLVHIEAPDSAMQGEYIVFKGVGNDKQWRWEFGESGMVDAREKTPLYAYSKLNTYTVRLRTENTAYPVLHRIKIIPTYSTNDSTDVMSVIGSDIRIRLQAICDGKPFNRNYNEIIRKYTCSNELTEVVINDDKFNDIYSYCQGLAATGKGRKITIEHVAVEIPDLESGCVTKIIVVQSE